MNFELGEEQVAIRDAARTLLADRWDRSRVREALTRPPVSLPESLWTELATLGWLGIGCDERMGGSAQDTVTAAILAEEAGRALLPGLLVPTLSVAGAFTRCAEVATRLAHLPDLIAGKTSWTLAVEEANGTWGPEGISTALVPAADDSMLSLTGTKILVPCGTRASHFLVACLHGDALCLAPVSAQAAGLTVTPMPRFDGEEMAELRFERVAVRLDSVLDPGAAGRLAREVYDLATVLTSAGLLGATGALLEMTTAYAKERVQFGRPIGAFQAVSHRLADVLVSVEIGRSLLYGACLSLEERREEASALVSAAKAWLSEAAVEAGEAALQLHGGIGYTWELDVHLYLRRVRSEAVAFGDAAYHRERVAAHVTRAAAPDAA